MEFDDLSNRVIGGAVEVDRELGPGLLESTCKQCSAGELSRNEITCHLKHRSLSNGEGINSMVDKPEQNVAREAGVRADVEWTADGPAL